MCKTFTYWQNLSTHTSLYLPMHLQIVDFNCKNYNVKFGYCNWGFFFWQQSFTSILDHLMQDVLNLIKE